MEYWITPQLFDRDLGTSCRHPVQITIGDREELHNLRQVSNRISLGFCYLTLRHSPRQQSAGPAAGVDNPSLVATGYAAAGGGSDYAKP